MWLYGSGGPLEDDLQGQNNTVSQGTWYESIYVAVMENIWIFFVEDSEMIKSRLMCCWQMSADVLLIKGSN